MKRFFSITLLVVVFVGAVLLTLFTKITTANADIAAGNQAYQAQDYETALRRYTAAESQAPGQPEPLYNAANAYYRQQALDKAQQALEQTLQRPTAAMAEFIHFNLGNIAYNGQQFDAAIAQYEESLRLKPDDVDAKYNLELALQQKQQQDQQQQQQQQQQDQNQQDQKNQQNQQNQSGGQQDPKQQQQNQQNQGQNQQDQENQSGGQQDQQNKQNQGQNQQDGQSPQNQSAGQQNQQPNPPQPGQQGSQSDQSQTDQQGQAGGQVRPGLTQEQARQLLAAIGGNGKTLMEQLQLFYNVGSDTPDKDW